MNKQELPPYRHTAERLAGLEASAEDWKQHRVLLHQTIDGMALHTLSINNLKERCATLESEKERLAAKLATLEIAFNALEQHAEQHIAELEATVKRLETQLLRQEVLLDAIQGLEAQLAAQSNIVKIEEGVAWIKQGDSWISYSSKQ